MPHELPQSLHLDWYRRRARELVRAYSRNDPEARERVGKRDRFQLADAQHAIALEQGYRNWTDFKRRVESHRPEPPVGRMGRTQRSASDARATDVLAQLAAPVQRIQSNPRTETITAHRLSGWPGRYHRGLAPGGCRRVRGKD